MVRLEAAAPAVLVGAGLCWPSERAEPCLAEQKAAADGVGSVARSGRRRAARVWDPLPNRACGHRG